MILNREQILSINDLPQETVEVPEWNGSVIVRTLTAAERDKIEGSMIVKGALNYENIRAKLVALTVIDENGERLFTDADVEALSKKSGAALDRIFSVSQRLSGMTTSDLDELIKN